MNLTGLAVIKKVVFLPMMIQIIGGWMNLVGTATSIVLNRPVTF